jgi:hypothetical protein
MCSTMFQSPSGAVAAIRNPGVKRSREATNWRSQMVCVLMAAVRLAGVRLDAPTKARRRV